MASWYHVVWLFLLWTGSSKCAAFNPMQSNIGDPKLISEKLKDSSSPVASVGKGSPPVVTYRVLMHRLMLKNINNSLLPLNAYDMPADPRKLADLVMSNFCEARFYGFNFLFNRRGYSDYLKPKDRYNGRILYHLMQDSEALNLLGYYNCLVIVNSIINAFQKFVNFKTPILKLLFETIAIELVDFLEFVSTDLMPKYKISKTDPEYNLEAHCDLEYPAFTDMEQLVTIRLVAKFKEVDFLRVLVRRFARIWPRSSTKRIIFDAFELLSVNEPFLFREVFTLMVRQTPEYFLHPKQLSNYPTEPLALQSRISSCLFNMTPILRALMVVDREEVVTRYLEGYCTTPVLTICKDNFVESLEALNIFIQDSNFAIVTSEEVSLRKKAILAKILEIVFDIEPSKYYGLAVDCLTLNYLPLYEAILQNFADEFEELLRKRLLLLITNNSEFKQSEIAISITLGYFEYNDFDSVLAEANKCTVSSNSKEKRRRIRNLSEIRVLLEDCPVRVSAKYLVEDDFVPVPWPCSKLNEITFGINDPGTSPKLFYYAQAILCKRFKIPFYGGSIFESTMDETATWSEMIGFINFYIERMISLAGLGGEKGFKFVDTTDYSEAVRKIV